MRKIIGLLGILGVMWVMRGIWGIREVRAQVMRSENFVMQGGNFNMTSGNKESQNFKLSDVVGQVAAGVFTSTYYVFT